MPNPLPLTSLADLANGVTVFPFHPKQAQWVNDRVKLLAMVTHQHFYWSDGLVKNALFNNILYTINKFYFDIDL
jgi:hypothetical protein